NAQPAANNSNPNFFPSAAVDCVGQLGQIPAIYISDLQQIFTTGLHGSVLGSGCGSSRLGGIHSNAVGYLTIDVTATCSTSLPAPNYFTQILFDNVLAGDYQDVNPNPASGNYAGGNPMV